MNMKVGDTPIPFNPQVGSGSDVTQTKGVQQKTLDFTLDGMASDDLRNLLGGSSNPASRLVKGNDVTSKEAIDTDKKLGSLNSETTTADIFTFMALFQKMAQTMRSTAREQRGAEMNAQVTALQSAADKMVEAAGKRYTAAIIQGAFQIAGGVMQAGMSAASAVQGFKGTKMGLEANDMAKEFKVANKQNVFGPGDQKVYGEAIKDMKLESSRLSNQSQALGGSAQASSAILGGLGGIIAAGYTKQADEADAAKARLDAQAKVADTGYQHANDMMQQMMEIIRDVRDKVQSMEQASVETNRGIARNI